MHRRWRGAVVAAVAAWLVAGCQILPGPGGGRSTSCTNMMAGACTEQVEVVAALRPGAASIDLTCGVPVCDRRSGRGTAVIRLQGGTQVKDTFAYAGNPAPLPAPLCAGVEPDLCRSLVATMEEDLAPSAVVVRLEVTCTIATCAPASGQVRTRIVMADGSVLEDDRDWAGAP